MLRFQGLNVEQHKRLNIAVEMAAKAELLLFLGVTPFMLPAQGSVLNCQYR